jgi:mRNA interferase RelE/StbE
MTYVILYLVVGAFFALVAGLHGKNKLLTLLVRSLLFIGFWPFLALLTPDFFSRHKDGRSDDSTGVPDPIGEQIRPLLDGNLSDLSDDERSRLSRVARDGKDGTTFFNDRENFEDVLQRFWEDAIPPEAYKTLRAARWKLEAPDEINTAYSEGIAFSCGAPDWYIGFSTEFVKSISKLDKNKRAQLLQAVFWLAKAPATPHGDTVKALVGDMAGLWRYRQGDYRLIYSVSVESKNVVLISFDARGQAYK